MNSSTNIRHFISRSPLSLLCLIGLTVFASPVAAQVFNSGPSDPALFEVVVNVPPTPDLAGDYVVPTGFQINIFDTGAAGVALQPVSGAEVNISGGTVGDSLIAGDGSEVNISGGSIGDGFKAMAGSEINIRGRNFAVNGDPLFNQLTIDEAFTVVDRGVTLTGFLADGSQFSFDLNSEFVSFSSPGDFFSTEATLTVTLAPQPDYLLLGDVNNSANLTFMDITPFVEVLMTVNSQTPTNPRFSIEAADINLDGEVNFFDISPFIDLFRQ